MVEKDDYYFVLQLSASGWENTEQSGLDPDKRLVKKGTLRREFCMLSGLRLDWI